jgi:hypothetical protein
MAFNGGNGIVTLAKNRQFSSRFGSATSALILLSQKVAGHLR